MPKAHVQCLYVQTRGRRPKQPPRAAHPMFTSKCTPLPPTWPYQAVPLIGLDPCRGCCHLGQLSCGLRKDCKHKRTSKECWASSTTGKSRPLLLCCVTSRVVLNVCMCSNFANAFACEPKCNCMVHVQFSATLVARHQPEFVQAPRAQLIKHHSGIPCLLSSIAGHQARKARHLSYCRLPLTTHARAAHTAHTYTHTLPCSSCTETSKRVHTKTMRV